MSRTIKNTAYKTKLDTLTDIQLSEAKPEAGALAYCISEDVIHYSDGISWKSTEIGGTTLKNQVIINQDNVQIILSGK